MTTVASHSVAHHSVDHADRLEALPERGPWMAGLGALLLTCVPAVDLAIESTMTFWGLQGVDADPASALVLGLLSLVLLLAPVLVGVAVRRRSMVVALLATGAILVAMVASSLFAFA
ncbi:hypothetical protein [Aestuariimicrobium ganziense]|uniref:hypothetical protein n=1 Tax=Aestuariimicrobium ganziense TaxID=2773677 RepID=UPI0019430ECA|nr:hypothetical protein [Aestuariimicrobium ganziense]